MNADQLRTLASGLMSLGNLLLAAVLVTPVFGGKGGKTSLLLLGLLGATGLYVTAVSLAGGARGPWFVGVGIGFILALVAVGVAAIHTKKQPLAFLKGTEPAADLWLPQASALLALVGSLAALLLVLFAP